jgi:hypothetical protein
VAVVGHKDLHEEVDGRCPVYDTIDCETHTAMHKAARKATGYKGLPTLFVADASGERVVDVNMLLSTGPQIRQAIEQAQQEIGGEPVLQSQIDRVDRDLAKGDAKLEAGKFRSALKLYRGVAERERAEFLRERAAQRVEALRQVAQAAIEDAAAEPRAKAQRALKKLARELRDLEDLEQAAKDALAELD